MKKLLVVGLMSLTLAQAKMFVGVDGGYTMQGQATSNRLNHTIWHGDWTGDYNVGINLGYEYMVNDVFGVRALFDAVYKGPFNTTWHTVSVGVAGDMIVNLVTGGFSMGLFAGFGVAYSVHLFEEWAGAGNYFIFGDMGYAGRTGLTFGIGENIRLDFTVKLPIAATKLHGAFGVVSPIDYQGGIKFLF